MNEFLVRYAVKHGKLGLSRTYVLAEKQAATKKSIAAYYTLAPSTVTRSELPTSQSLPSYPIPVVMLARLAVDRHYQGKGLGAKTLIYALRQAAKLSTSGLPAYGLILDVLDKDALAFYQRFNMFLPFTDNPMRLFVSMKTIEQI
ncbi:MAG: GNAT family N-acetyltransferase [Pseudomonadota bacterium]